MAQLFKVLFPTNLLRWLSLCILQSPAVIGLMQNSSLTTSPLFLPLQLFFSILVQSRRSIILIPPSSPHLLMRTIPISQMPLRTTLATSILLPMPPKKVQLTTLLLQLRLQRSIQHCSYPLHYTSDHLRRE